MALHFILFAVICAMSAGKFGLHLWQGRNIARCYCGRGYREQRMTWGRRERTWVRGNADICQEIDNSNKLVAKHSNRLPNGTIAHSNPPAASQTPHIPSMQRLYTYVRESDASSTDTMRILLVRRYSPHRRTDYGRICWAILFRLVIKSCR